MKFALIMRRAWDNKETDPEQQTRMLLKSLIIDVFKVLKDMASRLVQPPLEAVKQEPASDPELVEKAHYEITNILKDLTDYPTQNLAHLPIHERSLIALNKIVNFVEAASHFDSQRVIEQLVNSVIPLTQFGVIQTMLI
jgi:hypothetical protein